MSKVLHYGLIWEKTPYPGVMRKGPGISNIILCLSFSQQTQILIEPIYQILSSEHSLLSGWLITKISLAFLRQGDLCLEIPGPSHFHDTSFSWCTNAGQTRTFLTCSKGRALGQAALLSQCCQREALGKAGLNPKASSCVQKWLSWLSLCNLCHCQCSTDGSGLAEEETGQESVQIAC